MDKNFKVLISEEEKEYAKLGTEVFEKHGFVPKYCEKNGRRVLEKIEEFEPDVVLMDVFMSGVDGIGVIKKVKAARKENTPVFVIMSHFASPIIEREAIEAGAAYYLIKPFSTDDLLERITDLIEFCRKQNEYVFVSPGSGDNKLECTVTEMLHQIGVPAHIKGYHYIRDSIIMCVRRPQLINAVTKELYPSVAKRYETTPSRVERAIRHAIEVAWDRGDLDVLNSYFGYTIHNGRGKPTNSEFVAMLADRIRLGEDRPVVVPA